MRANLFRGFSIQVARRLQTQAFLLGQRLRHGGRTRTYWFNQLGKLTQDGGPDSSGRFNPKTCRAKGLAKAERPTASDQECDAHCSLLNPI
jgi:hypothetical protein